MRSISAVFLVVLASTARLFINSLDFDDLNFSQHVKHRKMKSGSITHSIHHGTCLPLLSECTSTSASCCAPATCVFLKSNHGQCLIDEAGDMGIRFSKIAFPVDSEIELALPLTSDDFLISAQNDELLDILKTSLCPSVVKLDDYEVYLDVQQLIETEFVGGYPSHAENDLDCPFWDLFREVVKAQAARRNNSGQDPAIDLMPLPIIWEGFTLKMVAEAVHDEYPNYHQSLNLSRLIGDGNVFVDNNVIPKRSEFQFLRGPVLLADINTWATRVVGPHSFAAKYLVGRCRPEEIAWDIKIGAIPAEYVPRDILLSIDAIPNFNAASVFTAYPEGSPRHPSWPAMHSAASQTSFWMSVVLDLSPEELCQARLVDYGVAYARTIAGVHYPDDNIAGLNFGQEVLASLLPMYLSVTYESDEEEVLRKITEMRYDWYTFDPTNPCPFLIYNSRNDDDGGNKIPRTIPPVSSCQSVCYTYTNPFIADFGVNQKCDWEGLCSGCPECDTTCDKFCFSNTNPWIAEIGVNQKCDWKDTCGECPECFSTCKQVCFSNTNPWSTKCTWDNKCQCPGECGRSSFSGSTFCGAPINRRVSIESQNQPTNSTVKIKVPFKRKRPLPKN